MTDLALLLESIRADPGDPLAWLALADGLEESGEPLRAELTRLTRRLLGMRRIHPEREELETRLRSLLSQGVRPCMPELQGPYGMRFVLIPPGRFEMGSGPDNRGSEADEMPLHEVSLTRAFWMGVTPVTVGQYQQAMRRRAWEFEGDSLPAHGVSYLQAQRLCDSLSRRRQARAEGRAYRLPTEAEWEYACRAGTAAEFHLGEVITSEMADVARPYNEGPRPVGQHTPNAFGLLDMHGSVYEWCSDWHSYHYYQSSPAADPRGPDSTGHRTLRSACWIDREDACRSASRNRATPEDASVYLGVRLVFTQA
jgi:uncharacterized protein (TIGR02996 family)